MYLYFFLKSLAHSTWNWSFGQGKYSFLLASSWQWRLLQVTHDRWNLKCDTWHETCDRWHMTGDIWHQQIAWLWEKSFVKKIYNSLKMVSKAKLNMFLTRCSVRICWLYWENLFRGFKGNFWSIIAKMFIPFSLLLCYKNQKRPLKLFFLQNWKTSLSGHTQNHGPAVFSFYKLLILLGVFGVYNKAII